MYIGITAFGACSKCRLWIDRVECIARLTRMLYQKQLAPNEQQWIGTVIKAETRMMTKSIISSCVRASHFKNVRMQENQLWQTEYTQGPKISQISYPSKEDTVEYIYIYI